MISIKPNEVVKEGLLFSQSYRDGIGAEFWRMTRWWADLGKEGPKAWCYGRSCFLMSQTQRWSWRVFKWCVHCACSVAQSRLTLWDPMDCSLPGSSVQGISQARILEWVAISSSRNSFWPRDRTHISWISCIGDQILYCRVTSTKWIDTSWNF